MPDGPTLKSADAAAFLDGAVVTAYQQRPPYPDAVIDHLIRLITDEPRIALELGCGTGEIARRLAPRLLRVDAVDPSAAMLRAARASAGGDAANISWVGSTAEKFDYAPRYALAVAAESFHWMDRDVVMRRLASTLSPEGRFVIIGRGEEAPWGEAFRAIIPWYSECLAYRPRDFPAELETAGLWRLDDRMVTPPARFRQRVEDYIELQHSRSAFARYRMDAARAQAFDDALLALLEPYASEGYVMYDTTATLAWGRAT